MFCYVFFRRAESEPVGKHGYSMLLLCYLSEADIKPFLNHIYMGAGYWLLVTGAIHYLELLSTKPAITYVATWGSRNKLKAQH